MIIARITFATMAAVSTLAATPSAQAHCYEHVDQLALRLEREIRTLDREFKLHFRHSAHYQHLRSDSYEMRELSAHIHEVAHHHGSIDHLDHDLEQLDSLFHHVVELVGHIEADACRGYGYVRGHVGHVRVLLARVEDTLHHLASDVKKLRISNRRTRPTFPHRAGISPYRFETRVAFGRGRAHVDRDEHAEHFDQHPSAGGGRFRLGNSVESRPGNLTPLDASPANHFFRMYFGR